eukprot:15640920-Heterocapsa_arctica.AAC.1
MSFRLASGGGTASPRVGCAQLPLAEPQGRRRSRGIQPVSGPSHRSPNQLGPRCPTRHRKS